MSRASKLTLAGTSCMAVGIVVFVHFAQKAEKAVRRLHPQFLSVLMLTTLGHACWGRQGH